MTSKQAGSSINKNLSGSAKLGEATGMADSASLRDRERIDPARSGKRLFIDATNVLRWGPHIRTGIARVEASLISAAISGYGDRVQPFSFDPTLKRCRLLTPKERAFVDIAVNNPHNLTDGDPASPPWHARVRKIISVYRLNPFGMSFESHRAIAQYLSGSSDRHGAFYVANKLGVRIMSFCFRVLYGLYDAERRREIEDPLANQAYRCLLSISTCRNMYKPYRGRPMNAEIFLLVYDTIPLDYPEVVTKNHHDRFGEAFAFGVSHAGDLVCISKATKESCSHWCAKLHIDLSSKRFHVVPIASPLASVEAPLVPLETLAGRPFVVYCSTIEPRKNHSLLLEVWARLATEHGADKIPVLVFVGKWAWRDNPIEPMISRDQQLKSLVRIFSYLPDEQLIWLYRNAEFTVFPSTSEGWGLGATESLDFGTPVIISDILPLREATQNLMPSAPADDIEKWQQTITNMIFDAETVARLRGEIRTKYSRRSPDDVVAQIATIMSSDGAATTLPYQGQVS
jgi:glycosyltransferase involved in cell wall biosynthesis